MNLREALPVWAAQHLREHEGRYATAKWMKDENHARSCGFDPEALRVEWDANGEGERWVEASGACRCGAVKIWWAELQGVSTDLGIIMGQLEEIAREKVDSM